MNPLTHLTAALASAVAAEVLTAATRLFPSPPPHVVAHARAVSAMHGVPGGIPADDYPDELLEDLRSSSVGEIPDALAAWQWARGLTDERLAEWIGGA